MSEHTIELLKHQIEVLEDTGTKEICLLGGIGTGKSVAGALWIIKTAIENPGCKLLIAANTYTQLMNASVETLVQLLEMYDIEYTKAFSGAKKHIKIGRCIIYLYSLEKYDNIRGIEVSGAWLDEAAFAKEAAYKVVKGRLRGRNGPRTILLTTSPNSFNWVWKKFEGKDGVLGNKSVKLVRARTDDNIFLPDGYYEDLLEEYGGIDSPLARQELLGHFVSLTGGSIYWAFDRKINLRESKLDKRFPVYVGMDFNIENMNAVLIQYIGGEFLVCERIKLTNHDANTYSMAKYLVKNYSEYSLQIIPDSTGSSRKTSAIAGQSDHQILKDHGLVVLKTKNPLIRNRQNNFNIKLKNKKVWIDPKLQELVQEIETLSSRDKEGDVSHAAVSLGYVLWYLDPLKRVIKQRASYSVDI